MHRQHHATCCLAKSGYEHPHLIPVIRIGEKVFALAMDPQPARERPIHLIVASWQTHVYQAVQNLRTMHPLHQPTGVFSLAALQPVAGHADVKRSMLEVLRKCLVHSAPLLPDGIVQTVVMRM